MRPAFALVVLFVTAEVALLAGCAPRKAERPVPYSAADTLANGLPTALIPKLASWVETWKQAAPNFAAESLVHGDPRPFAIGYRWADSSGAVSNGVRARALVDVVSPDSTRSIDFDMYLGFWRDQEGRIEIGGDVDSAPVLADFASDSLWQVAFCGTPCFFDGAYWVDAERFALTGAAESGRDGDGAWRGFLDIYDLRTRLVTGWVSGLMDKEQLSRHTEARNSALVERLERAGLGAGDDPSTASRVFARPR